MMYNGDCSSSDESDFMSPFAPLRATFPSPKCESETLTARKDSSFIGARMSPVAFDDDDERNEDRDVIAPFRQALHESMDSSFSINERTSLLGRRSVAKSSKPYSLDDQNVNRNDDDIDSNKNSREQAPQCSWGMILCAIYGFHLACMCIHDLYVWYLSYRLGRGEPNVAWRLPLLSPSIGTLTRFGAFVPWQVLDGQAWRMITSLFMSNSLVEYLLISGAWYALHVVGSSRPTFARVVPLSLLSTVTGQLWAMAWDQSSISGGASWGTCGILCATRTRKPRQRYLLLVISTSLLAVSLIDSTTDSIMGTLGSSLFGYAYYFNQDRVEIKLSTKAIRMLSAVVLLSLWLLPILWIAFSNTASQQ